MTRRNGTGGAQLPEAGGRWADGRPAGDTGKGGASFVGNSRSPVKLHNLRAPKGRGPRVGWRR